MCAQCQGSQKLPQNEARGGFSLLPPLLLHHSHSHFLLSHLSVWGKFVRLLLGSWGHSLGLSSIWTPEAMTSNTEVHVEKSKWHGNFPPLSPTHTYSHTLTHSATGKPLSNWRGEMSQNWSEEKYRKEIGRPAMEAAGESNWENGIFPYFWESFAHPSTHPGTVTVERKRLE